MYEQDTGDITFNYRMKCVKEPIFVFSDVGLHELVN